MSIKNVSVSNKDAKLQAKVRRAMAALGMRLCMTGKRFSPGQVYAEDTLSNRILSCVEHYYSNKVLSSKEEDLFSLIVSAIESEDL